jgi:hypothetical protein
MSKLATSTQFCQHVSWHATILRALPELEPRTVAYWEANSARLSANLRVILSDATVIGVHVPWLRIQIGTHKSYTALAQAIRAAGFEIGERAASMLHNDCRDIDLERTEVDLALLSPRMMGFSRKAPFWVICAEAEELGFRPCPEEVGPQLRLQYPGQPRCQRVLIGMKPLGDVEGNIFCVSRNAIGTAVLDCKLIDPQTNCLPDENLVFLLG